LYVRAVAVGGKEAVLLVDGVPYSVGRFALVSGISFWVEGQVHVFRVIAIVVDVAKVI